jgi:hypothetical protein
MNAAERDKTITQIQQLRTTLLELETALLEDKVKETPSSPRFIIEYLNPFSNIDSWERSRRIALAPLFVSRVEATRALAKEAERETLTHDYRIVVEVK